MRSTELLDRGHNADDVFTLGDIRLARLSNSRVLHVRVLLNGSQVLKHREVSPSHLVAGDVTSAVSPVVVALRYDALQVINDLLLFLLGDLVLEEREGDGLLVVNHHRIEPLCFVLLRGCLWHVAMLPGQHFKNRPALAVVLSIVCDEHGHLTITVGLGLLDRAPLFHGDSLVLKLDPLGAEHVADGLSTALNREVEELGHIDLSESKI